MILKIHKLKEVKKYCDNYDAHIHTSKSYYLNFGVSKILQPTLFHCCDIFSKCERKTTPQDSNNWRAIWIFWAAPCETFIISAWMRKPEHACSVSVLGGISPSLWSGCWWIMDLPSPSSQRRTSPCSPTPDPEPRQSSPRLRTWRQSPLQTESSSMLECTSQHL